MRAARAYVELLNLKLVVAWPVCKVPNLTYFPHGASDATQDLDLIERALRGTRHGILSARVGEHLVVDADVRSGAVEQLAKAQSPEGFGPLPRTWTAETPTGGSHHWFRHVDYYVRGHVLGKVELMRGNRLITLSPSIRAGGRYRWTQSPLDTELAEAPQWLQQLARAPEVPKRNHEDSEWTTQERESRARAYMAKFDPAIQGSEGSRRTIAAAVVVLRGFDLDDQTAFGVLSEWNQNCAPPWNDKDLRRKLRDARHNGRMEFGEMLRKVRAA
jgi:hypothetical protein